MTALRIIVGRLPVRTWGVNLLGCWLLLSASSSGLASRATAADAALPKASVVVDRILERAAWVAGDSEGCAYTYDQRARMEELDAKGKVLKATEKTYLVYSIQGLPFSRLTRIEGEKLTEAQLREENRKEEEFRKKLTARDFGSMAKNKETWITRELMDRFEYVVHSREVHDGREMLVVDFVPHLNPPPERQIQDRILGRLAGRMWVDEEEAEVAKIEMHLTEGFSLGWLGILGSLQQCDVRLERQRQSEGCWLNLRHSFYLVGRKLISPMRIRSVSESSSFRRGPTDVGMISMD
jgi:hypothetical protein